MKRRTWLLSGLGAAGALIVGWGVLPPRSRLGSAALLPPVDGEVALNGWLKIAADGTALLAMNRSEMGQGVHTGLAQLVAEELELPLARVRLIPAGHDAIYGNVAAALGNLPYGPRDREDKRLPYRLAHWITAKVARELGLNLTGGSSSLADAWEPLRWAAATARAQLLAAAAAQHRLPLAELQVQAGVIHRGAQALGHYGQFAAAAAQTAPGAVQLKPAALWRQIGQAKPRLDLPAKVDGSARFGLDQRPPGLLFAAVRHAPQLGGGLGPVANAEAVRARAGVRQLVALPPVAGSTAAYAVVAGTTWHAREAARALEVAWTPPAGGALDSAALLAQLEQQAREAAAHQGGFAFTQQGDAAAVLAGAAKRLEAVYSAPYLAHATLEPMNCTAQVKGGRVHLWAPTQVPGLARELAARVAGVPEDAVSVEVSYLGGGFGRRLELDFIGQAVRVAMATEGLPVQLSWSREEDMTHDFYRPADVAVLQGGLDGAGRPLALAITNASDAMLSHWSERVMPGRATLLDVLSRNSFPDGRAPAALLAAGGAPDKTAAEGLFDQPYAFAHQRIAHVRVPSAMPVGMWRSVGHSHHAFFKECFIDELAHAAQADPLQFRLTLLQGLPRHQAVLKRAAEAAGWGQPLPEGVARGLALHESFDTVVAQVVEVVSEQGQPRARRVVCALDCGTVVNPAIVARQVESAVVFGLTAALWGRIDVVEGAVKQQNFGDHPLLTLAQCPPIETFFVPSERAPSGVGEPGLPPVAPALANAWFALTGERRRRLPLVG